MPNEFLGRKRVGDIQIRSTKSGVTLDETYEYMVLAESVDTSHVDVITTADLPVVNQSLETSGLTICRTKRGTRDDGNARLWHVVCEFSSDVEEGQDNPDPASDPTAWVPVYETKFERIQQIVYRDYSGTAIANSAGQPFSNALTVTRKLPKWEFFQFEPATVTDQQIIDRSETVNTTAFQGRAIKTLLLTVLSSVIGYYYGNRLRLTQYSLVYDFATWQHKRLDVGTVYKTGSILYPYLDNDGNVINGPLNGAGAKTTVGTAPSVLTFDMYNDIEFSDFLRTA